MNTQKFSRPGLPSFSFNFSQLVIGGKREEENRIEKMREREEEEKEKKKKKEMTSFIFCVGVIASKQ